MSKKLHLPKWFVWLFAAIAFLGFVDATYLTVSHYSGAELTCNILHGCDVVTTSKYSLILGIPVALLGALYYLFLFILSMIYIDGKKACIFKVIPFFTVLGLGFSAWFTYVQVFILQTYCQYCLLSAVTSTLLFILGMFSLRYKK